MPRFAPIWLMLVFTNPQGIQVAIDSDQIVRVTYGGDGICESRSLTTIVTTSGNQCVKEGFSVVVGAVNNAKTHGANQ